MLDVLLDSKAKAGKVAISKMGHDKNHVYVIVEVKDSYVLVVDGKTKTLDKPKKKNIKHIQMVDYIYDGFVTKKNNDLLRDEDVKRFIKIFIKEHFHPAYK